MTLALGAGLVIATLACTNDVLPPKERIETATCSEASGTVCLAFGAHFTNFVDWYAFPGASDIVPDPGEVHSGGVRKVYINKLPKAGSKSFAVGTVIVKDIASDKDVRLHRVFAMVKRGGGFNVGGATDWEWFELIRNQDETATVRWQGLGPPAGEKYSGDKAGGCNSCHSAASSNDFVLTRGLKLP
jgi:hypothetical protein